MSISQLMVEFLSIWSILQPGDVHTDNIKPDTVESWMASMKISKTSVNIYLRSIRSMFNWGFKRDFIKSNPFADAGIKLYKVSDTDPNDYFSLEEVELILKTLKDKNETMWRLVFLALETGGRTSKLLALREDDLDLEGGRILFRGKSTKSGKNRYIPLHSKAVLEIKGWKPHYDERVFRWSDSKKPSKRFTQALRQLGLDKTSSGRRTFHTLRHTYASHLLMAGVNIFIVSRWLGHSSVTVTENHYGHLIPEMLQVDLPY